MTNQDNITYCHECDHCFKNKRSKTGYSCEVWGHGDFASDTVLSGYCHKAKRVQVLDSLDGVYMFETEKEAEAVLAFMKQLAEQYDAVFQADLKCYLHLKPKHDDGNYGWFKSDIEKMRIVQTERGYFIEFPQALSIL